MAIDLIKKLSCPEIQEEILNVIGESGYCFLIAVANAQEKSDTFYSFKPTHLMKTLSIKKAKFYKVKKKCEEARYLISNGPRTGPNSSGNLEMKINIE